MTPTAEDSEPVIVSPALKSPLTIEISRVLATALYSLTLAVVPLVPPVTISLYTNDPLDVTIPATGFGNVTSGAITYFAPPFEI